MYPPPTSLLFVALALSAPLPAAAQFIPLDEQEATLSDEAVAPLASLPPAAPCPGRPGPTPQPTAIITADGDASQFPSLYGAHRAFPSLPDQSAMRLINGARSTLHDPHIIKRGGSSNARASLRCGLNAAIAACSGSWCQLVGGFITTRAHGSAALFARGDNTRLLLEGPGLSTWRALSPGIIARNGASISGEGVTISTQGEGSPALLARSWANLQLGNCRIITTKHESPALDTNADASLRQVDLLAQRSSCCRLGSGARVSIVQGTLQGHGLAAIHLSSPLTDGADGEPAQLNLRRSSVQATAGAVFRVNNISANLSLDTVTASGSEQLLLLVSQGSEGAAQANGGQARLQATGSRLNGDIRADALSSARVTLGPGTRWHGTASGRVSLSLHSGAQWNVSGDSQLQALDFGDDAPPMGLRRIQSNGFTIRYNSEASPTLGGKSYELPGGGRLSPATP